MKCLNAYCQNQCFTASGLCGPCEQGIRSPLLPAANAQIGSSGNRSATYTASDQEVVSNSSSLLLSPPIPPTQGRNSFSALASEYRPERQPQQAVQASPPPSLLQAPVTPMSHNSVVPRRCVQCNKCCVIFCLSSALGTMGGCAGGCIGGAIASSYLFTSGGSYGSSCCSCMECIGCMSGAGVLGAVIGGLTCVGTVGLINCCRACAHEGHISIQRKHFFYGLDRQDQRPVPQAAAQLQSPAPPMPQEGEPYLIQPPAPPVRQEEQLPNRAMSYRVEFSS